MSLNLDCWADRARRFFGSTVTRDVSPYRDRLAAIRDLGHTLSEVESSTLGQCANAVCGQILSGLPPEEAAVETFALVCEAARRSLGFEVYDEQIIAGLAMHEGYVAEMQTGEGKTLAAVAPVALAAFAGAGAHVLTFNDYLARRDARWMGPIYRLLGLDVAHVQEGMSAEERRRAYAADVTYLTAKEAGFDHLRDRLCLAPEDQVQRPLFFALVDEADSILIDEARIPLVIAGHVDEPATSAERTARLAPNLVRGVDFDTDDHDRNIFLTDHGSRAIEHSLGCDNLYESANLELLADLRNALHAEHLLARDVDYIVRNGRVELVDDFTGRVAERRQWPDGLQAAIEAKERVELQREGRILGSVTMQHFIGSYPGLAGMTATASPAAEELCEFYDLDVVVIRSHRECRRVDHEDLVFTDQKAKTAALVEEITEAHAGGRPILVGTASVLESERLATALAAAGIPARVLNAKNDEAEAEIIAGAGALGAVTISTNMAGRGTDIRLGGPDGSRHDEVAALGGLYVIGTNRHESLRVDRQLRGRAGRQGDPGSSRFFVSLEDPLVERYGMSDLPPGSKHRQRRDGAIDDPRLAREIARTQRIVEGSIFDIRKRLWHYSVLIEGQRRHLQGWREDVLHDRMEPDLLRRRSTQRWSAGCDELGSAEIRQVERRLTLLTIDRCWSDHLADTRRVHDGIHVVGFVGKDPLTEYTREVGAAFETLIHTIENEIVEAFEHITISADGVNWLEEGLLGPSSTWTYLVSDDPFGHSSMRNMANQAGVATAASAFAGPFLFLWGLLLHWRRWGSR